MPSFIHATVLSIYLIGQMLVASNEQNNFPLVSFRADVHQYLEKEPRDPFTLLKAELESGNLFYEHEEPHSYLESLLQRLKISKYSQQLVFSTTSLQLSRISPRTPRAIYFNEDLYLGYVAGGQIEVIGIDPDIGAIPYIFSPPTTYEKSWRLKAIRSRRCMNCHASPDIGGVPGLLISSVIPGPGGGSIDAFRQTETGHAIPYELRFGGWHLTGNHTFPSSWANSTGVMSKSVVTKIANPPGTSFNWNQYLVSQSDVIANLVLEHQVGFINRCLGATYRLREFFLLEDAREPTKRSNQINREANRIVDYVLFRDEVPLPKVISFENSRFAKDFQRKDDLLRQFNLKDRLMQRRCSYMIKSLSFEGLPKELKETVFSKIRLIMTTPRSKLNPSFSYLGETERKEINDVLETISSRYAALK